MSEETRRKIRITHIKNIEKYNKHCFPNFNLKACEYFKNLMKKIILKDNMPLMKENLKLKNF